MKFARISFQAALFVLLIGSGLLTEIQAQQNKRVADSPDNCETVLLRLDVAANHFNQVKKEESVLIIIAVGAKGVNPRYNSNRISDAVKYLAEVHKISNEKIVIGISPISADKLGYLKFYVNGELLQEITTRGKGRICLSIY